MTFSELTQLNKGMIRSDSNLTLFFISAYEHIFHNRPSCSGCSINNELDKLFKEIKKMDNPDIDIIINKEELKKMSNITFQKSATFRDNLIAYKDKDGRIRRKYTNKLTDEFVIEYLTNGTADELNERKSKFKVLPLALREEPLKEVKNKKKRKNKEVEEIEEPIEDNELTD